MRNFFCRRNLPKDQIEAIMRAAMKVARKVHVDQLDCSVSMQRQATTKTVEEVLQMGLSSPKTLWNFTIKYDLGEIAYADIGCCTMTHPDYFLWIETSVKAAEKLVKKFNLVSDQ